MQGYSEYPKTVPKLDCGRGLGRPRPFSKVQVGGIMRSLKILPAALALSAMPLGATAQQLEGTNQVVDRIVAQERAEVRSEEHTSELQSRLHLVCRLLLEKKKSHS